MENKQTNENLQGINTRGEHNTIKGNTINIYQTSEPKPKPSLTEKELKDLYCNFLQQIQEKYQYLKLFHTQKPVKLLDQYIPIQVTLERQFTHEIETVRNYGIFDLDSKDAYATKGIIEETKTVKVDWEEAKKDNEKIMVLADPGMGKSTLLKNETVIKVKEELEKIENKSIDDVVFPLFIRLSELAREQDEIIDIIPNILRKDYPEIINQIEYYLKEKLEQGKCLLLLDALDEVPKDERISLTKKINTFLRNYPCQVICTSRIVGYAGNFIDGGKEVEIVPFDDEKTADYIKTWFNYAAGKIEDDTVSADGLINELKNKPQIQGLAQNPLLLSLLCSLYQSKGLILPARRTQVYAKAVNYILSQWSKDNQRNLSEEGWVIAKQNLLEFLAYEFSCKNQEVFSGKELSSKIDQYLNKTDKREFKQKTATELIKELTEDDGIIQTLSAEGNQYLFLHRTFQEYFTASYLKEKIEKNEKEGLKLIKAHFWEYDWHETIILVAGLLKNPIPLLKKLQREKDDIFKTMLLLSGSCLTECFDEARNESQYDALVQGIIDDIFKFWQKYPDVDFITIVILLLEKRFKIVFDKLIDIVEKDEDINRTWCASGIINQSPHWKKFPFPSPILTVRSYNDLDPHYRLERSYAEMGVPIQYTRLLFYLKHEDVDIRKSVSRTLGQNPNNLCAFHSILYHLKQLFKHQNLEVLNNIFNLQGITNINDLTFALIGILQGKDNDLRWKAVWLLGEIGDNRATPALIKALDDDDSDIRWRVPRALIQINDPQAIPALIEALKHDDSDLRWRATEALGNIGNEQAIKPLISLLNDEDEGVRNIAAWALDRIATPETLKNLIKDCNINIYDSHIFTLARKLAIRYSRRNLPYIPVYPHLVRYFPIKRLIKRLFQS
ncbi:MAG: NACHT domain-containing NTPase [Crocosphaera sp.]